MSEATFPEPTREIMRQILFIHSAGPQGDAEGSGRFLSRLRAELGSSYEITAPDMPAPEAPEAASWLDATAAQIESMSSPFTLLGHSLGGSIILQHLARNGAPTELNGVVTVAAPYWGSQGWDYPDFALPADADARLADVAITMLFGRQDDVVSTDHLGLYRAAIPTMTGRLIDGDHEFAEGDITAVADALRHLTDRARK